MKWKKFLSGAATACLMLTLFLSLQAQAQENTGSTAIKTTVPDTHTVLLDIGAHGSVLVNEKTYTHEDGEAKIERLTEQKYIIQADEGWQIESVRYGKADAQEDRKLTEHAFTAPAINSDDNKLTVRFEKTSSDGANAADKTDSKKSAGVRTGDSTNIGFYISLTAASALLLIAVPALRRRKKLKK